MAQQGRRQAQAGNRQQPEHQPQPAHRIDRLAKQGAGQQSHQQGLGIDQHRSQAGPGLPKALGQQPLK